MNTKKCSKCGWEYPISHPDRTCRFCQEPFKQVPCTSCGTPTDIEKIYHGLCRACQTMQNKQWRHNRKDNADKKYEEWLEKISTIPTPYKTLTEEQWLETCKHFGGCAYCGSMDISARSLFIPFKDGGKYCVWNVIPACEKCETAVKMIKNPFNRMDQQVHRAPANQARKLGFTLDNLQTIVDYLQSKMEGL